MKIIAPAISKESLVSATRSYANVDEVYASLTVRGGLCVVHLCGCNKDIDPCCGMKKPPKEAR